ncbi:hypothetical protein B8A42_08645 [Dolosigranulum pigrum]|uniref:helix-turn-helix domain-containing protein n=1 Tax=Dolosigranulum pigrum TaxID=29394 RepID=UPI000DBF8723|nr:helix-turn-helix transcriptional regulator [Dolosigranulum pigrum]RAN53787.1 hypothetical protein B8A42_08645 [Dolosigranulum pigrum]
MSNNTLGQRVKAIRSELNLSQKELAEKIGTTVSAVSNWECGRNNPNSVMIQRLDKLAGGYNLSPHTIQKLMEYLEAQEEIFYEYEWSLQYPHSNWLSGQVDVLEKIREWEND